MAAWSVTLSPYLWVELCNGFSCKLPWKVDMPLNNETEPMIFTKIDFSLLWDHGAPLYPSHNRDSPQRSIWPIDWTLTGFIISLGQSGPESHDYGG